MGPLPSLLLDGFDHDGIWGQIELRNEPLLKFARAQLRRELKTEAYLRKQEAEQASQLRNGCALSPHVFCWPLALARALICGGLA